MLSTNYAQSKNSPKKSAGILFPFMPFASN